MARGPRYRQARPEQLAPANASRRLVGAYLALALLCWAPSSWAFIHIVQPGDTLASIAERFYGRVQHENLLVAANALEAQGGIRIVPGMRLEVPALSYLRIGKGHTWKELSLQLLGSEHRAHVLATANGSKAWLPPDNDAEIVVPYNLRFIATGNETVVGLAYKFLGDRKLAWMLDHYNKRGGRRLERGDVVLLPIDEIELTPLGKRAAKQAQARTLLQAGGRERFVQIEVSREIEHLVAHIREGHYVRAVQLGSTFLGRGRLSKRQRGKIYRQLLEAYVALESPGLATHACQEWQQNAPSSGLDPDRHSPKLLAACQRVKPAPKSPPASVPATAEKPAAPAPPKDNSP